MNGRFSSIAVAATLAGCSPQLSYEAVPPNPHEAIDTASVISANPAYVVGAVTSLKDCSIAVTGATWGKLVTIDSLGNTVFHGHTSLSPMISTELVELDLSSVVVGMTSPPSIARLDVASLTVSRLPNFETVWGLSSFGTIATLGDSLLVVAPFGQQSPVRRLSSTRNTLADLAVLELRSGHITPIGELRTVGGTYLSSLLARQQVAMFRDTILSVKLVEGRVDTYAQNSVNTWERISSVTLPKYLSAPTPTEAAPPMPWIADGGLVRLTYLPSVVSAAFSPESGALWALRPYEARWRWRRESSFRVGGRWEITRLALEEYDRSGRLQRVISVPNTTARISSDRHGYAYFHQKNGEIVIAQMRSMHRSCRWPARIRVLVEDDEPGPK